MGYCLKRWMRVERKGRGMNIPPTRPSWWWAAKEDIIKQKCIQLKHGRSIRICRLTHNVVPHNWVYGIGCFYHGKTSRISLHWSTQNKEKKSAIISWVWSKWNTNTLLNNQFSLKIWVYNVYYALYIYHLASSADSYQ